jgi:hypothetical protein
MMAMDTVSETLDTNFILTQWSPRRLHCRVNLDTKLRKDVIIGMLLFADDIVILQKSENNFQKIVFKLYKLSSTYNFKTYNNTTKVMGFVRKYTIK